jgi:FKBP-type peptidyl-prolyl cis-trans isomerase
VRKPLITLLVATTATLALAGCTSPPQETSACVGSGDASNAITVTDTPGADPAVSFTAPLPENSLQRTVVTAGKGEAVKSNDTVGFAYAIYDATTGTKLGGNGFNDPVGNLLNVDEEASGLQGIFNRGIACSTAGSRIALAVPASDVAAAFPGHDLKDLTGHGIAIVFDVKSKLAKRASGADQAPQDGFPLVTLDDKGAPTVKIPSTDPPSDLKIEVLKKGDGPVVAENSMVMAQYQGIVWGTGKVFDQTWDKNAPISLNLVSTVKGFAQGLVGQTVGSQVVIVIPPALGYGEAGNSTAGISGTDTLVFVVDILATGPVPAPN